MVRRTLEKVTNNKELPDCAVSKYKSIEFLEHVAWDER